MAKINTIANNGLTIVENYNPILCLHNTRCSLLSHCSVDSGKAKHLLCTGMTLIYERRKSLFQSLWV